MTDDLNLGIFHTPIRSIQYPYTFVALCHSTFHIKLINLFSGGVFLWGERETHTHRDKMITLKGAEHTSFSHTLTTLDVATHRSPETVQVADTGKPPKSGTKK